jgi:hypothetical protein
MSFASTVIHSKLSVVKLDTAAGALTDISDAVDKLNWEQSLEQGDITTFGSSFKQWLPGYSDGKVSMSGPWSRALHVHMTALQDAFIAGTVSAVTLEYGPEGADSGDSKKSSEVIMTSYKTDSASKDPVKWEAEFMTTGTVTTSTY